MRMDTSIKTVDEYVSTYSKEVQDKLATIRKIIIDNAPDAIESISYGMPAYKVNKKPLVYFGGFANHIGFYAVPNTHVHFKKELSVYKQGKGSVQFPLDQPLPKSLIANMVKFRLKAIKEVQAIKKVK